MGIYNNTKILKENSSKFKDKIRTPVVQQSKLLIFGGEAYSIYQNNHM